MYFLQFFLWGAWMVTLGTYLLQTLHFSGRQVGMIYGIGAVAATLTPLALGVLADRRFASDRLLAVLHLIGGILMLILYQAQSYGWFYFWMLLYSCCYLPTFSLSNALCFHHLPDLSRLFPRVRVWGTIGWMVASALVSFLAVEALATPLLIAGVASLVQAAYCLTLPHTPPVPPAQRLSLGSPQFKELLRDKSLRVLTAALFLICIPSAYYYAFVNPYLNEIGIPRAAALMSFGQAVEIVVVLLMPWFFSRLRLRRILFFGFLVWGLRYFAFAYGGPGSGRWLLWLAIGVQGFAFAFVTMAAQLYVNSRVPAPLRSTAQGFIAFITLGLGAFLGSIIAGETVSRFALPGGTHQWIPVWWVPALVGTVAALWFWWAFPRREGLREGRKD